MQIHETLPDIDIAIKEQPREFLRRMVSIAREMTRFKIEENYDGLGLEGWDVINFQLPSDEDERGAGGQLIAYDKKPSRIRVEMRAPTDFTRESYIEFARNMFGPVLKRYNRDFCAKYRLRIEGTPQPFKLPAKSSELFSRFCKLANTSTLHPYDWQRFYAFVRQNRTFIPEHEMQYLLMKSGFSREYASDITSIYLHLAAFKEYR